MSTPKLFMVLLGCKPTGRHTEQHDIFFGIGERVKDLVPSILDFWPEANGKIHLDAYREVNFVDGYQVSVVEKRDGLAENQLFFINLGGYTKDVFDEAHQKILKVGRDEKSAISAVKASAFFKQFSSPHVDDKYALDVDDVFEISEILNQADQSRYSLSIQKLETIRHDEIILGYMPVHKL
jgi:hypothetical protein